MTSLTHQPKDLLLSTFEIAELNLLYSFKDIEIETFETRIHKDINPIYWIIGHCLGHIHFYLENLGDLKNDKSLQSLHESQILSQTRYGAKKEELSDKSPLKLQILVDSFLYLSDRFKQHVKELTEEQLDQISSKNEENWYQVLQRISLHFMGHAGQISILRRQIEGENYDFVIGVSKEQRKTSKKEWLEWWESIKYDFE